MVLDIKIARKIKGRIIQADGQRGNLMADDIVRGLYLELLKKCVTDYIYGTSKERTRAKVGKGWPHRAHTMIGLQRLDHLQYCIERVLEDNIDGDLIECGVWRGGATIFMRGVLKAYNSPKKVFVADSFDGLPEPDIEKYPADEGDVHHTHERLAISARRVKQNFDGYGLRDDQVIFIKGFFDKSLPIAPIEKLSIIRLDGDMYGSTWESLEHLYPKLQTGGFIIVDDYGLDNCKSAIHDYRTKYSIDDVIQTDNNGIPIQGCFWRKT
jgi:O-methyltransferase